MAYSYIRYAGNGSTTNYVFSFPYISADHIQVRVNGVVTTLFSFLNSSTVQMATAPASGAILDIRRVTPKETAIVNFTDGSVLLERDLDLLATFDLYLAQETKDGLDGSIQQDYLGVYDALTKRITNVGTPTAASDAVSKAYADTVIAQAEAASTAAGAIQTGLAATQALASADSATASSDSATASANSASAAAASYDSFDDRYLGAKAVAPTVDNDGSPLLVGATFWDSVSSQMFVWAGAQWKPTFLTGNAVRALIIATAGQTVLTVPTYVVATNTLQVFTNGVKMLVGSDYAETNQNTITFTSGLTVGDEVESIALQPYAIGTTGAESVSFQQTGTGSTLRTVAAKLNESVSVKDFGAVGDGFTDDSTAVQTWLNFLTSNKKLGYAPSGTYYCPTVVVKSGSFACPSFYGDGQDLTVFKGNTSGLPSIQIVGGSGGMCGAVISGITFDGNTTGYGVEICGQNGLTFRDCSFTNAAIGLLPHNRDSGSFTEFVVAENCLFTESCKQALVYKRTGGNDSFHGTGLRACTMNESASETKPKIEIGGVLSSNQDIIVYNAPLSFQIWKNTQVAVLVNNSPRYSTNFYGSLTLELFPGALSSPWDFCTGNRDTYYLGTIGSLQNFTKLGRLVMCHSFETKADGTVNFNTHPKKINTLPMVSGANSIVGLPITSDETFLLRVNFLDTASPARKSFLICVTKDPSSGATGVATLATLIDYYGGNMPYPVFTLSGNTLVATANFATTVVCQATYSKVGIGSQWNF